MNDHLNERKVSEHQGTVKDRAAVQVAPAAPAVQEEVTLPQATHTVQIVCADSRLASQYWAELGRGGETRPHAVVASPAEAQRLFEHSVPLVTLLDESAVADAGALEPVVALLAEAAPVVVVAASERQPELAFLMLSGAADFVPRSGSFVSLAAARVERRLRLAAVAADLPAPGQEFAADFGEIFRHELNNELTGILGNAELLLGRRDRLPPDAVERLQTITQLAVRVRETVRRLSHAWDLWQRQPRASPSALLAEQRPAARSPEAQSIFPQASAATGAAPPSLITSPAVVTTQWRSNGARRSSTRLASVPRIPPPQLEPEPPTPETGPGAAAARWDKTWRTRKG
jgi:hypothetical protein